MTQAKNKGKTNQPVTKKEEEDEKKVVESETQGVEKTVLDLGNGTTRVDH